MMNPIPYGRQEITREDINAVIKTLESDFLTQGPQVAAFEKAFSDYIGSKYAVAVANGTAALHLCALALDVHENTHVITTPITFAASANCILYCKGKVTFCDIDPATGLLDLERVRKLLKSSPKGTYHGIIPVDFAGYPIHMQAFRKLADEYNLWIIEDACHAPGGYFIDDNGEKQNCGNGKYADLAIFSFHPVKHIACGEGGMITTNNKNLYDKLIMLRTHGITKNPSLLQENHGGWYYEMQYLGFNYRLTDFQCALGCSQLQKAGQRLLQRQAIAQRYDEAFKNTAVQHLKQPVGNSHAYHLYIIKVKKRKELYDYLRSQNIFAQVHYIPIYRLPYYQKLGYEKSAFPNAEDYYHDCLSIPMYPSLTVEEQDYVIKSILEFYD